MIKLLTGVLLTTACLSAEAVPICMAVTEADASAIIGPSAKRTHDPSGCGWEVADHKKQLNVAWVGTAGMFERARAGTAQKGETQTENGLGGPAFSTIPSSHKGSRVALYFTKGSAMLILDIEGFPDGSAKERLPQMRDLMRKLAAKL